jgi:hypothetical protein
MNINYVIATWNGTRISAWLSLIYYEQVLKNHINTLNSFKNNVTQITIMKPYSGIVNDYYNVELNDNVKIIDCANEYQSYGQWLKAVELFLSDFDYFVFIEDDYVPAIDDFDLKLIEMYEEGTYLCSMADTLNGIFSHHAAISNGIISKKTIEKIILSKNYKKWFDEHSDLSFGGINYQIVFSDYLIENGISILDYRKKYKVDFVRSGKIMDFSLPNVETNEKIFTPIQSVYKMQL